jgi:PAS domain S-box-containing protein
MCPATIYRVDRLKAIVESSQDAIICKDMDGTITDWNRGAEHLYGYTADEVIGKPVSLLIPPDHAGDFPEIMQTIRSGDRISQYETVRQKKDGGRVDVSLSVSPLRDDQGNVTAAATIARDISDRKGMEKALSGMTRRLIEAQEERRRIGRELHDDINQRLAMLALEMKQLQGHLAEVGSRLQELREQTIEISNDIQALSHELHSSTLEYLAGVAGIKSWCRDFGERQRMEIEFKDNVANVLPLHVGVCLFRVLQEALHNAVKHSGTKRVEVQLAEHANEVHLIVRDSGRGFDIEAARQGAGLGLTSMQERVRLVSGTILIESKPMGGTTIHVRVPLRSGYEAQRAPGLRPI